MIHLHLWSQILGYFIYISLSFNTFSIAQVADDVFQIKQTNWKIKNIQEGIFLKQKRFNKLFGKAQSVSVLDIDLSKTDISLKIAYLEKGRMETSQLAHKTPNAIAAVNGTFFNMRKGGSVCFLKSNRKIINLTQTQDSVWFVNAEGGIVMDTLGQIDIIAQHQLMDSSWINTQAYVEVMTAGPLLILDNQPVGLASDYLTPHPRTAVGLSKDNHMLLITIDGRNKEAGGVTIPELTQLMQALNCNDALNLDGGGSTTMWIQGFDYQGNCKFPSDNGKFDHQGERKVANALIIIKN